MILVLVGNFNIIARLMSKTTNSILYKIKKENLIDTFFSRYHLVGNNRYFFSDYFLFTHERSAIDSVNTD
jgi:hypothetical protein